MKARFESGSDPVYGHSSFEKTSPSSTALSKIPVSKGLERTTAEFDNDGTHINGYRNHGLSQRTVIPSRGVTRTSISDGYPEEKSYLHQEVPGQQPLHFDTQEVLEETPPIFKSLTSGSRGPDTFVYLSSSSSKPTPLSQNEEDPCKTFVISSETTEFVNRKNSLNQSSAVYGFGNKINSNNRTDNEYLSYVIDKGPDEFQVRTMSEPKANGGDLTDGLNVLNGPADESDSVFRFSENVKSNLQNGKRSGAEGSDSCGRKEQNGTDETSVLSFDRTITGKKEQTFTKLQDELEKAHQELKLKDEEVTRLTRIREDVERELEELTASLFQEAHRMVSKAKEKQAAAEKSLAESQMKMDVLTAEVVALKTLVLTSTPSRPNPHLHPQIGREDSAGGVNLFNRKHRRSPSHFNLKYGRENSPPDSPVEDVNAVTDPVSKAIGNKDLSEVDPTIHKEFLNWSLNCKLDKTDPFIDRIYREDINLCLDFSNRKLAENVQKAIETRDIFIEAVTDKSKSMFPRKCALLEVTKQCHYRMKLGDQDTWYNISQMCRNRIIAVCDFINYLRYIELGLVKSSAHDMYWEIMRLRKEMILARLGLSSPTS